MYKATCTYNKLQRAKHGQVKPVHFASLTQLTNKSTASFNKIVDSSEGPVLCLAGQKLLLDLGWFFRYLYRINL